MPKPSTFKTKIKVIFLPFLFVGIGTIVVYGLFRWVFDVQLGLLPIHEMYLNFWVPATLPWIGILIWLQPRLQVIKFSERRTLNDHTNFKFLLAIVIVIPTIISQEYLVRAAYPLVELEEIEELAHDYSPNDEVVIFIPKNKAFADRLGHRLPQIFGSFGISALVVYIILLFTKIDERELQKFKRGEPIVA